MFLLSVQLLALPAHALDIDTFSFAGSSLDGRGGMQIEAPTLGWPGAFYGGLGIVYAHDPLEQVFADGTTSTLVQDSFATHVLAGYTILGKVRLDLDLPLYPYVGGPADPSIDGVSTGDARLQGVIPVPLGDGAPVQIAIIPELLLPTGEPTAYTGAGGLGAGLKASIGVHPVEAFSLAANFGVHATRRTDFEDQQLGTGLDLGLGGDYSVRPDLGVGLELDGAVDLAGGVGTWTDNPFELHAYGRYGKVGGLQALLGVGTGLVGGVGAPDVRAIAGLAYRVHGKEPIYDRDGDTIMDNVDACIDTPEDRDGFQDADGCPDPDNDQDGLLDQADHCPNDAEDLDGFEDDDGCPDPDNDKDGLLDPDDQCPNDAGTEATHGCPDRDGDTLIDSVDSCPDQAGPIETNGCPDRDKDLVPDSRDKCPDEPKDPREDPARSDGCPKRVFVTVERIEILDKIYFDTNKTTIKKQSDALLAEIASVVNSNPDIQKIEVAGHTDSVGNDKANQKLSQGRAEAVVHHLVTVGKVDPARLTPVGYGESKPIDTNATDAGRGNNRRVEFIIKEFVGGRLPLQSAVPAKPAEGPGAGSKAPPAGLGPKGAGTGSAPAPDGSAGSPPDAPAPDATQPAPTPTKPAPK